jgi:RHS repeat-associated protein
MSARTIQMDHTRLTNDLDGVPDAGAYAAENPWRFSTKPFDAETGLGYWGYRYYSPALGRWLSADPFAELGHVLIKRGALGRDRLGEAEAITIFNAYDYVRNDPLAAVDPFGEIYCVR